MIIDAHTHLSRRRGVEKGVSPAEKMVEALRSCGVDKALVLPLEGFFFDVKESNDDLKDMVKDFPDVLYPFCTVDPHYGEGAVTELRRCILELEMRGLKLHPWLQGFAAADPPVYPLIREAAELGVPVIFHDGTPPYCTPLQICHLARLYPDAKIVLGHSGLMDMWRNALQGAKKNENVYLCTTGPPLSALQTMVKTLGTDRLLFATDFSLPNVDILRTRLDLIYHLDVTEDERAKILGGNAAKLLGLESS